MVNQRRQTKYIKKADVHDGDFNRVSPRSLARRSKHLSFKPATPNRKLIQICHHPLVRQLVMRLLYRCNGKITLQSCEVERLAALQGKPVLLAANHVSRADGAVMFLLGDALNQPLYIMSNREQFSRARGYYGLLLQYLNCYSVMRGTRDTESVKFTRSILERNGMVVAFPEAGLYGLTNAPINFNASLFRLTINSCPSEGWVQPVAIRYEPIPSKRLERDIEQSFLRLEAALGLPLQPSLSKRERVRRIADLTLSCAEKSYGLKSDDLTLQQRLDALKQMLIGRVGDAIGIKPETLNKLPAQEAAQRVLNVFYWKNVEPVVLDNAYQAKLAHRSLLSIEAAQPDFYRLANWLAVNDNYLANDPTHEKLIDILTRLEREVLPKVRLKVSTACVIRLGEPIEVNSFLKRGGNHKDLSQQVQRVVTSLLEN